MKVLYRLIEIHFKELVREPSVLIWGIGFPIMMSLILGVAFSSKDMSVRSVALVNPTPEFVATLDAKGTLALSDMELDRYEHNFFTRPLGKNKVLFYIATKEQANVLLKRGIVTLVVENNQFMFDPKNPEAQMTYIIIKAIFDDTLEMIDDPRMVNLNVTGTRYIDFLIPGLISMGIMMSCMWGISYGFIEKRAKKLLRRLVATPMNKAIYLLSQILVRTFFGFFESVIIVLFAHLFFDFTIEGSLITLILFYVASHLCFSGIAILLASRITKLEIGQGVINSFTTPMMIIGGIFFSYQSFPAIAVKIIDWLPLPIVANTFRAVMLEGATFVTVMPAFISVLAIGGICFTVGLKIFKWY